MIPSVRTLVAGVATLSPGDPVLLPALRLAERTGVTLHLVHAYTPDPEVLGRYAHQGYAHADPRKLYDGALQARLEGEACTLSRDVHVVCHAHAGKPEEVLPRVAAEVGRMRCCWRPRGAAPWPARCWGPRRSTCCGTPRCPSWCCTASRRSTVCC